MEKKLGEIFITPEMIRPISSTQQEKPIKDMKFKHNLLHYLRKNNQRTKDEPDAYKTLLDLNDPIGNHYESLYGIIRIVNPEMDITEPRKVLTLWNQKRREHANLWKEVLNLQGLIEDGFTDEDIDRRKRENIKTEYTRKITFNRDVITQSQHAIPLRNTHRKNEFQRHLLLHLMLSDEQTSYSELTKNTPMVHFDLKNDMLVMLKKKKSSDVRKERFNTFSRTERLERDHESYNPSFHNTENTKNSTHIEFNTRDGKKHPGYIHGTIKKDGQSYKFIINGQKKSRHVTLHFENPQNQKDFEKALKKYQNQQSIHPLRLNVENKNGIIEGRRVLREYERDSDGHWR